MAKWLRQGIFAERVKDYCRKNDLLTPRGAVKLDILADLFNLHEDTVRQMLQNKGRKPPGLKTLRQVCEVLGLPVTEFIDAPTDPPAAMPLEQWSGLTERERALITAVLADLSSDALSVDEKEELCYQFQEGRDRIVRLRQKWSKGGK